MDTLTDSMQIQLIAWNRELDPRIRNAWNKLAVNNSQTAIFTYAEWFDCAHRSGSYHPWGLLTLRQRRRTLCILPLHRRTYWTAEAVTPLAEDTPPLLVDTLAEEMAWAGIANWVRTNRQIQVLSLGRWHDEERMMRCLAIARECGIYPFVRAMEPEIWTNLPPTWEEYLAQIGANTRRNFNRTENTLRRDFTKVSVEILADPILCIEPLEELMTLHHQRWQGKPGSFFDNPQNREFYRQAVQWAVGQGYAVMPMLRVDGRTVVVATLFYIPGQHTAYSHCIARDTEALPVRYSPGTVLMNRILRWMIEHGARAFAFGIGTAYYKKLLGGKDRPRWEVFFARSPFAATTFSRIDAGIHLLRQLPSRIRSHASPRQEEGAPEA